MHNNNNRIITNKYIIYNNNRIITNRIIHNNWILAYKIILFNY